MALHTLPAGRSVIEGLEVLGTALEYEVEKEWPIGQARAAVDLAWFATEDRRVALMIFEVESSASASMANNAMKVLARDVEDFIKPLFFFHVLLSGGPDNERIRLLREQWGKHNYRVYRLLDDCEFRRLVVDILGQHRRIRSDVSVGALWHSLRHAAWSTVPPGGALDEVQQQGFKGNYLRDLSRLALEDEDALAYFLQHLYAVATGKRHRDEDQEYGGYVAYHYEQFLESAILIHTGYISDASGPDRMEAWQQRSGYGMRTIGPYFGLSRDYDVFVLGIAPFLYGLCGVLVCDRPRTMA